MNKAKTVFQQVPLVVDLDGTLLQTDCFWESLLLLVKKNILFIFLLPFWLLKGKTFFKIQLSQKVSLRTELLPFNQEVLAYLKKQKKQGRQLILATASLQTIAESVVNPTRLFFEIIGSDIQINCKGSTKASILVKKYGEKEFDYIGNSSSDLLVWKHCRKALVVSNRASLIHKIQKTTPVEKIFFSSKSFLKVLYESCRIFHCSKNLLILVPAVLSHRILEPQIFFLSLATVCIFSLFTSAIYLLNDLIDLESDRFHSDKKNRPVASGTLSIPIAFFLSMSLLLLGTVLTTFFIPKAFPLIIVYLIANSLYTFYLKKVPLLDVFLLSGFYCIRILIGYAQTNIEISSWLLGFSLFFFLGLGFMKRVIQLHLMETVENFSSDSLYSPYERSLLESMGLISSYLSLLLLAVYINSPQVSLLYSSPSLLFLICIILLYWVSTIWLTLYRKQLQSDPLVYILKDKKSYICALLIFCIILIASLI